MIYIILLFKKDENKVEETDIYDKLYNFSYVKVSSYRRRACFGIEGG